MNIAKRLLAVVVTLLLALSLTALSTSPAEARTKKADRRPCVSKAEYRGIHRNMTGYQVRALVDSWGTEVLRLDDGYYPGAWVEDGYWDSEYVEAGYWEIDEQGFEYWVDTSYYIDVWVDNSYYDEYAGSWVAVVDTFRTYRKCKSFQRGRGRVVVNFDNYSSPWTGLRVYAKGNTRSWSGYGRVVDEAGLPEKPATQNAPARPARPAAPSQSEAPHAGDHRADALADAKQAGATLVVK